MDKRLRGQDAAVKRLRMAVHMGRVAHAYLFTGPAGVGKHTMALSFARALLCAAPVEGIACEKCHSCQLFAGSGHPDLHTVAGGEAVIGIDQVRWLASSLGQKPFYRRHVVVIDAAERATIQAQNAFLKMLEESCGDAVFVLVTAYPEQLLPTVLSRCFEVRFQRLSPAVVVDLLTGQGVPLPEAVVLSRLCGGSLGRALFLRDPKIKSLRAKALGLAREPGLRAVQEVALLNRQEAEEFLEFLHFFYRDAVVFRLTGDAGLLVNVDYLEEVKAITLPMPVLLAATQVLKKAKKMLRANVNPRLVLEGVAVRLGALVRG